MNRKLTLSQAVEGYLLEAQARHLSPHTLADYQNTFRKLGQALNDPPISSITAGQIRQFLSSQTVAKKTILNYHTGLSALWNWALAEGIVAANLLHEIPRPRPEKRAIQPFSEDDLRALLGAVNRHVNADRDRAILLLLIDTGLRAGELSDARIHNLDLRNRRLRVFGKGSKERILPISPRTAQALWKYLAARPDENLDRPLFVASTGDPLTRDRLLKLLYAIGRRANVQNVHPHRFRHTFAILYLRNGGDPWSLQALLGHADLTTVRRYLAIAQTDLDAAHRLASPVDRLRL